ncbi:MAG: AraC family transcriptional regulator, partial [Phycisphaeraceae bacterium]|nr:AraC family transcriptional regulator [Phycisphaeraceae bacterium]
CDGLDPSRVSDWLKEKAVTDAHFRAARQRGGVEFEADDRYGLAGHAMMHLTPASYAAGRWWWMMAIRKQKVFEPRLFRQAGLLLEHWQVRFHRTEEARMGRVILGEDQRIILADVGTRATVIDSESALEDLAEALLVVVRQRFPDLGPGVVRDCVLALEDRPCWLRFRYRSMLADRADRQWYIEIRPLEEDDVPVLGELEDPRVARAVAFLHEHFSEAPALADIAEHVHTSPFHFHRIFSREVGISPKQYLQRKQLQVARWRLRSTNAPIGDVATETGFASHGHFTSTFHRLIGVSPSEYRKQASGETADP